MDSVCPYAAWATWLLPIWIALRFQESEKKFYDTRPFCVTYKVCTDTSTPARSDMV